MKNRILIMFLVAVSAVGAVTLDGNTAQAFSNRMPDPSGVMMVNANTRYVRQSDGFVRVWFPNNSGSVEIRFGNYCAGVQGDAIETEDGSYGQWANGAAITKFKVLDTNKVFYGRKGQNCNASHTFTFSNIPDTHQENGYYYRDIAVTYVGGHKDPFSGAVNNYLVVAPGQPNVRIGSPANDSARTSGYEATMGQLGSSPTYRQYNVPFGTKCTVKSAEAARIYMYDLDNAGGSGAQIGRTVTVKLYDRTAGGYVNFTGSSHSGNPGQTWTPADRQNDSQWVSFTARPDHKYRLEIRDVYFNNTIQYSIPYAQIYNEPCASARIVPKSTVNGSASNISRPLGSQLTFRNWATTASVDSVGSDTFQLSIAVTQGSVPGGAFGPITRQIAPARDIPDNRRALTFTPTTIGTYCLETRIRNFPSYVATPQGINSRVCATITAPPVGTDYVELDVVLDEPADRFIEPTEETTFVGRVMVANFPELNAREWGYDEVATQANPVEVGPTRYNYSYASSDSWAGRSTASKGGCARRNSSGTCVSWYWYCDGSYMGTGSSAPTCPGKWTHTCQTYSFTNTNRTGTCTDKSRYVCPSPNGSSYIRVTGNEPDCNVYRCQYAGAPNYITSSPSKYQCEKRCNNGTGARPLRYSSGDMNCYQRPEFTLECQWDDQTPQSVTVRNNGAYCESTYTKVGQQIGVRVCAEYSAENPYNTGGWRPARPSPGYGSLDGGSTFTQLRNWLWRFAPPMPESKCVEVVAKPTVKVRGGDVAAGGVFANSSSCTGEINSSIVTWPNDPNFDASGTTRAAYASRDIFGFTTAMDNYDWSPRGLAFANDPLSGGERFGGSFNSSMPCLADHNGLQPTGMTDIGSMGGGGLNNPNLNGSYTLMNRSITNSPTIKSGAHVTLYANGDVYIGGNGIFYERTGWATLTDIPAFKLVVSAGNIYIDPSVRELNGIYVAQPSGGVGGNIYTCATSSGPIPGTSYYGASVGQGCRTPLTVNGSFIAKKVHLGRSEGTAIFGQTSEQFNYLPELWLGQWPKDNTTTHIKYDAMVSLPPIL